MDRLVSSLHNETGGNPEKKLEKFYKIIDNYTHGNLNDGQAVAIRLWTHSVTKGRLLRCAQSAPTSDNGDPGEGVVVGSEDSGDGNDPARAGQ